MSDLMTKAALIAALNALPDYANVFVDGAAFARALYGRELHGDLELLKITIVPAEFGEGAYAVIGPRGRE